MMLAQNAGGFRAALSPAVGAFFAGGKRASPPSAPAGAAGTVCIKNRKIATLLFAGRSAADSGAMGRGKLIAGPGVRGRAENCWHPGIGCGGVSCN